MPPAWSAQLITLVKSTGVCSIWTESVFPIGYECDIDTGDAAPVPCGNIRYGVREAEIMRKHITAIVDMGHIYEIERSQYLSEATLAPKPHQKGVHDNCNFKCRFCVIYVRLNRITRVWAFPGPRCDNASMYEFGDGRVNCFFDCPMGYSWIAYELQVRTSLGRRHNLIRFQI